MLELCVYMKLLSFSAIFTYTVLGYTIAGDIFTGFYSRRENQNVHGSKLHIHLLVPFFKVNINQAGTKSKVLDKNFWGCSGVRVNKKHNFV